MSKAKDLAQDPGQGSKQHEPLKRDGSKKRKVKVYRNDENRDAPITVFVNEPKNKREFYPGEPVELSDQLIEALKDAREESSFQIPPDSGIYETQNPKLEAERQYPGYQAQLDLTTGTVWVVKDTPRYIVEHID